MSTVFNENTGKWETDWEEPNQSFKSGQLQDICKFDPLMVGLHHFRPASALVECSFWGQYYVNVSRRPEIESSIILSGERYLSIDHVIIKSNWLADHVEAFINDSVDRTFFIHPTPYLEKSLKRFNYYSIMPPKYLGQSTQFIRPKVKYTSITSLREQGNITSELDDLKKLATELIACGKIRINENSNFDISQDNHMNSFVLVLKEMLELLLTDKKTLYPPVF